MLRLPMKAGPANGPSTPPRQAAANRLAATTRIIALTVAAVSVSVGACGGSGKNPAGSDPGGSGGSGGEGGSGGTGGGAGAEAEAGTYDAPPVPGSLPLAMAPALVAGVVCAKMYACCQPTEGLRPLTMTQAGCDVFVSGTLTAFMGPANAAIAQGRAAYDADALATCLMGYTAKSCAEARTNGGLSAYRMCNFVQPLVPLGGACQYHIECLNGYCLGMSAGTDGACVARKANGQACMADEECTGGDCANQVCADARPDGLCVIPGL